MIIIISEFVLSISVQLNRHVTAKCEYYAPVLEFPREGNVITKHSIIIRCLISYFTLQFFPKWIAPNLVTFIGFLFTALNFIILSWYDWGFYASTSYENTTPVPNWFWLMAAINIFLAYTLDGIDGKLARRIGLSGPLGELFDHGLDSYTAPLIPSCLYSIFGRGPASIPPLRMYYIVWMVLFNFFISHFEKYNTGVLYLPWGYDFGMWGSTLMFLTTWFGTFEYWKQSLPFGIPLGLGLEFLLHASALSSVPMVVINIYRSYKYKTGKMRSPLEAARPFFPFLTFLALLLYWISKSPNHIMDVDTRAVFLLTGTIFSNVSVSGNFEYYFYMNSHFTAVFVWWAIQLIWNSDNAFNYNILSGFVISVDWLWPKCRVHVVKLFIGWHQFLWCLS